MELEDIIKNLKKEIDRELEAFLNDKEAEGRKNNMPKEFFEAVGNVRSFMLRGGKRLRPILFYYGYTLAGGTDKKEALRTAIALEFLHIGFLIHDDVMDRDSMRHNGLSIHAEYEQDYGIKLMRKDMQHFGSAMAICLGDAVLAWNYEILARSSFEESAKKRAVVGMSRIITETAIGQMLDEILQFGNDFSEEAICKVHNYKTARYTIQGPLQLGAILAGAGQEELDFISRFSIPLGIAYQIKDDIIGIFEEQEKIGKPVGSDIREGKKTLLVSYSLKKAADADKKFIFDRLGDRGLEREGIEKIREIMKSCGALEYSEQKINEFTEEFLLNLKSDPSGFSPKYSILDNFAEYLLKRKN
jgi:geranylgeranyl diphosphate synthase type I